MNTQELIRLDRWIRGQAYTGAEDRVELVEIIDVDRGSHEAILRFPGFGQVRVDAVVLEKE